MRILHVALTREWVAGQAAQRYEVSSRGRMLADEGFIHASTSRQVEGVLGSYYADLDPADLSLLVIDVDALEQAGSPVRWDQVPGAPAPFPHIYGPIVPSAVVAVLPISSDLTPWDVAADAPR
jgi:glutathione S-transferase